MFNKEALIFVLPILFFTPTTHAQLDDPTRPPGYRLVLPGGKKAATAIRFSLSSVRISSTRRTAVINDRMVEVGNKVNGAKVLGIYPSSVKLKKQNKIFTVRLLSRISKKTIR